MKRKNKKLPVILGILCTLLLITSSWYTITFNDSRWFVPMDLSDYVFRTRDLPMLLSVLLTCLYVGYLCILLMLAIISNKRRDKDAQTTREISPKLGFLGFFGFLGLIGFWSYSVDKTIFPFAFFIFFGFFGFFFEGKMSNTFMDERYKENKMRAHMTANRISLGIIFLAMIVVGQGRLMMSLEITLIAFFIVVVLALALELFLSEYLLYRYDHDDSLEDESEEIEHA